MWGFNIKLNPVYLGWSWGITQILCFMDDNNGVYGIMVWKKTGFVLKHLIFSKLEFLCGFISYQLFYSKI